MYFSYGGSMRLRVKNRTFYRRFRTRPGKFPLKLIIEYYTGTWYTSKVMERVPCVVIGAGVVGLAIGRALSQSGLMTLVLEKNSLFGAENSSRNSEVLHAGLYYTPGSKKANMCRTGKHMMLDYLKERNVPYNQCGKLVVASTDSEIPILHKIMKNGQQNGLTDLKLLIKEDIKVLEPSISCKAAMLSPFTGVFDSHTLMLNCVGDIEDSGSSIVYNCTVEKVSLDKNVSSNR